MNIIDPTNTPNQPQTQRGIFIFVADTASCDQAYSKVIQLCDDLIHHDDSTPMSRTVKRKRCDLFSNTYREYITHTTAIQQQPADPHQIMGIFLSDIRYGVPDIAQIRASLHMAIRNIHIPINMVCAGTPIDLLDNLIENPNNIGNPFNFVLMCLRQDMRTLQAHINTQEDPDGLLSTAYIKKKHLYNLLDLASNIMHLAADQNNPVAYHESVACMIAGVFTKYMTTQALSPNEPKDISYILDRCIYAITYAGLPIEINAQQVQLIASNSPP